MAKEKPNLRTVDTTLLNNPRVVDFIARQRVGTTVFFPEKAAEIARSVKEVVRDLAGPWLAGFDPYLAVKAFHEKNTLEAIFAEGFKADVATEQEVHLCLWAGRGLISPKDIGHSNVWVSCSEIDELIKMGVRRFVVDKQNVLDWLSNAIRKNPDDQVHVILRILLKSKDQGDKFGSPLSSIRGMAQYARELGLVVDGVACHTGTLNSYAYMSPADYGLKYPKPKSELFNNYAKVIREIAPLCNELHAEGLIGSVVNTEGGYRPPYSAPEYDWQAVMGAQAQAFQSYFDYPIIWAIEPGRLFAPVAIAKILVNNVDTVLRAGDYPYAAFNGNLYAGYHDWQWTVPLIVRETDVLGGKIYTHDTAPEQFARYILVGYACAGSDQVGVRDQCQFVLLPKDLKPGEVLWALPVGSYMSSSMGPQAFQIMEGRYQGPNYGFNGIAWPTDVVYKPRS